MDTLSGLLHGPRARGAFVLRSVLSAPWSLRIRDQAPLSVAVLVAGRAWILSDGSDPVRLDVGDVVIARGPQPYTVADDPSTPPQVLIEPGQICLDADGNPLSEAMTLGVRTWGNDANGDTTLVTGTYEHASAVGERMLRALPDIAVVRAGEWPGSLVPLLAQEVQRDQVGQDAFLDRLLDLVVLAAVRGWFATDEDRAPGWYRADTDAVVGPALRLMQAEPERGWTIASLSAAVGVSRAGLARRFTQLVGQPPMAYLMSWRMALAADLLDEQDATVTSVARQVGYATPFAFSTAFKRERGMSPRDHRLRRTA